MPQSLEVHGPEPEARPHLNLHRHASRCAVCRHPNREIIEDEFLHWRNPSELAFDNRIKDRSSIYRHARAFGLMELRRQNILASLEHLIERADDVPVTAHAVIRAVQLVVKLTGMERAESATPEKSSGPGTPHLWPQPILPIPLDPLPTASHLADDEAENIINDIEVEDGFEDADAMDDVEGEECEDDLELIEAVSACQPEEAVEKPVSAESSDPLAHESPSPRHGASTSTSEINVEAAEPLAAPNAAPDPASLATEQGAAPTVTAESGEPTSAQPELQYGLWIKPHIPRIVWFPQSPQPGEVENTESEDSKGDD